MYVSSAPRTKESELLRRTIEIHACSPLHYAAMHLGMMDGSTVRYMRVETMIAVMPLGAQVKGKRMG